MMRDQPDIHARSQDFPVGHEYRDSGIGVLAYGLYPTSSNDSYMLVIIILDMSIARLGPAVGKPVTGRFVWDGYAE